MDSLIPLFIFGFPFLLVIITMLIRSNENKRRDRMRMDLWSQALERGEKLPGDLFRDPAPKKDDPRKTGILMVAIAVGITLFMLLSGKVDPMQAIGVGLVPLMLGIGFLIVNLVVKNDGPADER